MKPITLPDLSSRPFGLEVERLMESPSSLLYKAWTEQFDRWFAAPGTILMKPEVNQVFFFETIYKFEDHREAQRHPHYGRFLRLVQDSLIEMTWVTGAEGTKGAETVVTVVLEPNGNGTHLHLTQKGFPDEESKNQHEVAWGFVLEHLDKKMLEGE